MIYFKMHILSNTGPGESWGFSYVRGVKGGTKVTTHTLKTRVP